MNDVAKEAGVSVTTVSHVINETRPVAGSTRDRVLLAIRELSYYKNTSARLLVRGESDSFGLIISDIENPFFPEIIKSFEQACLSKGMDTVLCTTNYARGQAQKAIGRMLESRVRGVAILTSQLDSDLVAQLAAHRMPVVLLDSPPKRSGKSNITVNYSRGISGAVRHLYDLGHRAIGLITGPLNRVSAAAHRQSVMRALSRAGCEPRRIVEGDNRPEGGAAAAKELLTASNRPTAILCGNDRMAIGAMSAAFGMGLRVPQDVSIIGTDDILLARYSNPPLTTIRVPRDHLGRLCFEVLERMLRTKRRLGIEQVVDTQLVIRQSTGPAIHKRDGALSDNT
jgi:DNA-binding LacI/PurR family transcriptional regulator